MEDDSFFAQALSFTVRIIKQKVKVSRFLYHNRRASYNKKK